MPFSNYIMSIQPPKPFKPPTDMDPYDGSTDPQEHLDAFKSRMVLTGASDPIKCRAFPIMMKKAALKWFNSLARRSINRFSNLSSIFLAYFTARKFKLKMISSLLRISQWQGESLQDFLERYNAKMLLVEESQTQATVLTLLNGLRPWPFKSLLSKHPARTLEEIQMRVEKYIFLEEIEKATTNLGRNQAEEKHASQEERSRRELSSRAVTTTSTPPSMYPSLICSKKSNKWRDSLSQNPQK